MTTRPCPACDAPILVAAASRHGGQAEAFDPEAGTGDHYDTMLAADLSHITLPASRASRLKGKVPLYRRHQWSCAARMQVPMTRALPGIGGYSHRAVVKDGQA